MDLSRNQILCFQIFSSIGNNSGGLIAFGVVKESPITLSQIELDRFSIMRGLQSGINDEQVE